MQKKLSDFRIASEEEIKKASKHSNGFIGEAIYYWSPGGFHRTIIYKVMDETFGPPNGYPWEHSTWEWVIFTNAGLLTVYDHKGSWSIGCLYIKPSEELKVEAKSLGDALFTEAKKVRLSKKQIKKGKIGGSIFPPYSIYRRTTEDLMSQAHKVIDEINKMERTINNIGEVAAKNHLVASLYRAAFMTTFLTLEGFVNLIYFLFTKDRYRIDMYGKRLEREMLPIKILEMDIYCHSFKYAPLTHEDELFSAIQYFINIRNQFLHANISETMETCLVKQGNYYIAVKGEPEEKYGLTPDIRSLTNIHIIRANKLVEKFVIKTLQSLTDRIKVPFTIVHSYIWIDYIWDKPDSIKFPLEEEDYVEIEYVEEFLEKSTKLDKEYYDIKEKEFKPLFI